MNKFTLLTAGGLLLAASSFSQTLTLTKEKILKRCATVEATEAARTMMPNAETTAQFEDWMKRMIRERNESNRTFNNYTLPVVFHIIHNGETEGTGNNIARAFVESQLHQLNKDFANQSNSPYTTVAANTQIQFKLATQDPWGSPLAQAGIERIDRNTRGYTDPGTSGWSMTYINNTIKPNSIWDPSRYINIWVMPISGGILGFATFPASSTLTGLNSTETFSNAGVVVAPFSVGSIANPNGSCSDNEYNLGRTLTHEMGHFFGLRHIWGDANCGDDYVNDTPVHEKDNGGAPTHPKPNNCGTADEMFENYMDYTDDRITNTFTAGQVQRIQTVMLNSPRRKELATSNAATATVSSNKVSFFTGTCPVNAVTVFERSTSASVPKIIEVPIVLQVENTATGSATVNISATGTATSGTDFQILNPSITFANGEGSKTINLRIFDDAVAEPNETITLSYTITGTGVTAGTTAQTITVTIVDNDGVRPGETPITLLNTDFTTATGWGAFSTSGAVNLFTVSTNGDAGGSGNVAHITNNTATGFRPNTYTKTASGAAVLRSPLIDASGLNNITLQYKYKVAGEVSGGTAFDYGYAATAPETQGTNFTRIPGTDVLASNTLATGNPTIALPSSFNGSKFYLGFYWQNDDSDGTDPGFNVDDVVMTASGTKIETAANTNNAYALATGTVNNFKSLQNDKLITIISNVSTNISALAASIVEAGTDRPSITTQTGTFLRSRKVIKLSPPFEDNTTSYTATFFFTANEVAGWGTNAANLRILKVKDGVDLNAPLNSNSGVIVVPTAVENKLATEGYISYTATFTGFSKFVLVDANTTLPVDLLDFKGTLTGSQINLKWSTSAETNNKGFEVERSIDGVSFKKIGWVDGLNGSLQNNYQLADINISRGNKYFYRLKQVDNDGRFTYSPVINIAYLASGQTFSWYPNPVKDKFVIQNNGLALETAVIITDMSGRVIYKSQNVVSGKLEVSAEKWTPGVYSVQLTADGITNTFKIVKD